MELIKDLAILVGRICIGSLFIWAAFEKIIHWHGTVAYAEKKKIPHASLALPLAVVIQVLGGLALFLGYYTRIGALVLILFIIPAAILFHNFWNVEGEERVIEKTFFMKDVAVFGSLLLLLVLGGGHFSIN
jgi:putative oxidoreductase